MEAAGEDAGEPEEGDAEVALYRAVVEHISTGVMLIRCEKPDDLGAFRCVYWNKAARKATAPTLGYDLVGKMSGELPQVIESGLASAYARALGTGETQSLPRLAYGDQNFPHAVYDVEVTPLDSRHVALLLSNVTGQVEAQRLQQTTQRLESVGRVAAGVAHDFANLLTVVNTHVACLKQMVDDDPVAREDLRAIDDAVSRGAKLTSQLVAFSRGHSQVLSVLSVNDTITEMFAMLESLTGDRCTLDVSLASDLGATELDARQLEQVLMNVAVNARDAMKEGGTLTITTANVSVERDDVSRQYVCLRLADTGIGMDADTAAHAFDPFFTTKGHGGSGLGLATVYGIVAQSGGFITIDSEPGEGTSFDIHFPRTDASLSERRPSLAPTDINIRGTETILVVDDEPMVLGALKRALSDLGYEVLLAGGGEEALERIRTGPTKIDIVLSDVMMPEMNGHELARNLQMIAPELPVVLLSGFVPERAEGQPHKTVLHKPISIEVLAGSLRRKLALAGQKP